MKRALVRRGLAATFAIALTLVGVGAVKVRAQSEPLTVRASRRDTITAGATVTATFALANQRDSAADVTPRVEAPIAWGVLTGAASLRVGPRSTELLILSVAVPARSVAGVYTIRVSLAPSNDAARTPPADSVVVLVPARSALEVGLLDRPGFVVSGRSYEAGFLVRNRGNISAAITLKARSSLGAVAVGDTIIRLDADASRVVRARVRTPAGLETAIDDVLELSAVQIGDSTRADVSSRVTVIPEPSRQIEEYLKVPTQVHLRAASSEGVSPFEIFGRGNVRDGGATLVDFMFRGPAGQRAWFGERDEYRVDLTSTSWRARIGDQFFMPSLLTAAAQPGFGAGFDLNGRVVGVGGYAQQFRRAPEKGSESGAYVSARPIEGSRVALNFVSREGGPLTGRLGSAAASYRRANLEGDVELARSQSNSGAGLARSVRVNGNTPWLSYDLAHLFADTAFSGPERGSEHDYLTTSTHYANVIFVGTASTHRADLSRTTGVPYRERLDAGTFAANVFDRVTMELGAITRAMTAQNTTTSASQRTFRVLTEQDAGVAAVSMEGEIGRAQARTFTDVSLSARRSLSHGAVALWTNSYSGGSITKGTDGTTTLGTDVSVRTTRALDATLSAYATRVNSATGGWYTQIDAQLARLLPNGSTITVRARLLSGGALPTERSVAYLDYGMPLRLPVSRLRTPGRVFGRVVDAGTGRGVANALVRLGPQIAITDDRGQVAFGGVPGGQHRVSLSQETSFADAVFVGDPTLVVDSTRTQPTLFTLAIARSARVDIDVRRFAATRTDITGGATTNVPDSLGDVGALANASLMLAGERDTLYRTTNDAGKASFTDVPPGSWTITVRGDAPAFHRFDPDRLELTLKPGENRQLRFRLVPRRREVQLIGGGQELRPAPAGGDPKAPNVPGVTKTVKPNQR